MSHWEENDDFLARWLSDELSPREKADFENSAEGKEYIRMIQAADKLSAPAYDAPGELNKLKGRIAGASGMKEAKTIWMRPVFRYALAASVTALIVVAYFVFQSPLTKISTQPGQQEIVILPDGSEVRMNAASVLSYNENTWKENRNLTIEGEAFFQVVKGSSFVVNTDLGAVTVLGTSFNVKTRNKKLEVVCYTGKVNVSSTHTDEDLLPGDGVRVERGSVTRSWKREGITEPTWIKGLTFYDEPVPVKEAIDELGHVFGIKVLNYDLPDTLRFQGGIPHSNAAEAVDLVMGVTNVNYEYDSTNNTLRILGLNP